MPGAITNRLQKKAPSSVLSNSSRWVWPLRYVNCKPAADGVKLVCTMAIHFTVKKRPLAQGICHGATHQFTSISLCAKFRTRY